MQEEGLFLFLLVAGLQRHNTNLINDSLKDFDLCRLSSSQQGHLFPRISFPASSGDSPFLILQHNPLPSRSQHLPLQNRHTSPELQLHPPPDFSVSLDGDEACRLLLLYTHCIALGGLRTSVHRCPQARYSADLLQYLCATSEWSLIVELPIN